VIAFDGNKLANLFEEDPSFGLLMTRKAAQVIRKRLHKLRIEYLAFEVE